MTPPKLESQLQPPGNLVGGGAAAHSNPSRLAPAARLQDVRHARPPEDAHGAVAVSEHHDDRVGYRRLHRARYVWGQGVREAAWSLWIDAATRCGAAGAAQRAAIARLSTICCLLGCCAAAAPIGDSQLRPPCARLPLCPIPLGPPTRPPARPRSSAAYVQWSLSHKDNSYKRRQRATVERELAHNLK